MRNPAMKRVEKWLKLSVLPPIGASVIRGLGRSMRMETKGQESMDALYREGQHVIIAFWHAHQLMMPLAYRGTEAHIDQPASGRRNHRANHLSVRASGRPRVEHQGWCAALRELIRLGRSGADLVVTPDGPKGPGPGGENRASSNWRSASGLPIVPLAFGCSKKNTLRAGIASWSRTLGRAVCICWGAPIWVPRELDEAGFGGCTAGT